MLLAVAAVAALDVGIMVAIVPEAMGMKPMSADRLATVALRGVAGNRAIIVALSSVHARWMLAHLWPPTVALVNRVSARRVPQSHGRAVG